MHGNSDKIPHVSSCGARLLDTLDLSEFPSSEGWQLDGLAKEQDIPVHWQGPLWARTQWAARQSYSGCLRRPSALFTQYALEWQQGPKASGLG